MKTKIKHIASISNGFYIQTQKVWVIKYLQGRDFDDFWSVREPIEPTLPEENVRTDQLLKDGDVLFSCKWTRNIAALYKLTDWPCVASSTFFIVRVYEQIILPEYLAIVLNEAQKSNYFKNNFSGSTIKSIPKHILEEYEINIPPLQQQETMIQLYKIYKQQITLYDILKTKKSEYINWLILS